MFPVTILCAWHESISTPTLLPFSQTAIWYEILFSLNFFNSRSPLFSLFAYLHQGVEGGDGATISHIE